jgi:hypothetical protein
VYTAAQEGEPLPQSAALPIAALAAHIALCAWQEYRRRHDARSDRKLLRKLRGLTDQFDRIEDRVNELSRDRTQAAAAVTRLFAVRDAGGESWEEQDARRSR